MDTPAPTINRAWPRACANNSLSGTFGKSFPSEITRSVGVDFAGGIGMPS
ncbi:protein of unknown function [Candidatus Nitrosacidococcus tergens]|uniref:Uncharacterized protein n=1 Tax=Candidatus Nitrosacidococcus tergens TaxID=553981 RepID=A0A7G1QAS4_9GAMM|nr:protein of unknown function [Candidatus Nitrosacidococcus tergens]